MLPKLTQKGYISAVLIVFALLMATLIFPFKFPTKDTAQSDGFHYCREFVSEAEATTIELPARPGSSGTELSGRCPLIGISPAGNLYGYSPDGSTSCNNPYSGGSRESAGSSDLATFKSLKLNVPIRANRLDPGGHHVTEGEEITLENGKKYRILYPKEDGGKSYDFNTEDGLVKGNGIVFKDYGVIFLQHLNDDGTPVIETGGAEDFKIIDVYQDVSKSPIPQVENVLKCVDEGALSLSNPVVIKPEQEVSLDQEEVQMEWFTIKQTKALPYAWWTPECKPAIYLYPNKKQLVNVKVFPEGHLTYVDPPYDLEKGWTVTAFPNGQLETSSEQQVTSYDYLYYESKIRDDAIRKPEKGWVVKYSELTNLYNDILPKLGLNEIETRDFVEYWEKSLPEAPYYFVGIINQDNIDQIERLEITPKPDSINRVRVYFERLESFKQVEAPTLPIYDIRYRTNDFRVVEWGGMVKNDPNHPFTCSQ